MNFLLKEMEHYQDLERKKGTGPKSMLVKGLMEWTGVTTLGKKKAKNLDKKKNRKME